MPRMQVYLPDDLHRAVKERGLKASKMLQDAIRHELTLQAIDEETDRYLAELAEEVGEPTPEDEAWAEELVDRVVGSKPEQRAS